MKQALKLRKFLNEHKWKHSTIQLNHKFYPVKMAHGGGPSRRKSDLPIDDSVSDDEVPPPDGGWGWVWQNIQIPFRCSSWFSDVQTTTSTTILCHLN